LEPVATDDEESGVSLRGRRTDVYEPVVLDADPNSSTYNTMVRPHWHYTYDASGNELSQTDPKGDTTTFSERCMNRIFFDSPRGITMRG
jgi:hypothetical protein